MHAHIRLLVVQTSSLLTPEVRVLYALLNALPALTASTSTRIETLIIQGVEARSDPRSGRHIAALFRQIPNVAVYEIDMGKLGQHDRTMVERARKIFDVMKARLAMRRLPAQARAFRADIVYSSQQTWDVRIATPLARVLACPQVIHLHYVIGPWLGKGALAALRQARMVLGISDFIRDDALRHGLEADHVHRLYNSLELPPELSSQERAAARDALCTDLAIPYDSCLVGMIARMNRQKGQDDLMQAMLPILQHDSRVHLILVGTENPAGNGITDRIRHSAREHNVERQVHLIGHRTDVPILLAAFDLFAHPSHAEPFSMSILEAEACGLPVVAWRAGGPAELIVSGETGLLAEPMDMQGLTEALRILIYDPNMRLEMGHKARERVACTFNPSTIGSTFISLLQEAKAQKGC